MKKLFTLFIALLFIFPNVACGAKPERVKVKNVSLTEEAYAFAINKNNDDLKEKVDTYLNKIRENGELEEIINSFFDGTNHFAFSNPSSKEGCLVVATNAYFPPFEYYNGNKLTGIDILLANNIAKELGKKLYVEDMDFSAIIPSIQKGNCDIGMAGLTVNEERLKTVNFSNTYYNSSQVLIIRESDTTFDNCSTAEEITQVLKAQNIRYMIGAQNGTSGYMYARGDSGFGYEGFFNLTTIGFTTGTLAIRDLSNGKLNAVILDLEPALSIVNSINKAVA